MSGVFSSIPAPKMKHSYFNLSHEKKFDCDMGQLIPILFKPMVPGDMFKIGNQIVARTQPQVAATLHEINIHTYYFFIPTRLLFGHSVETTDGEKEDPQVIERTYEVDDHDWETFITGGVKGDGMLKGQVVSLPHWEPTGIQVVNHNWNGIPSGETGSNADWRNVTVADNGTYSLWDYFGLPVDVIPYGAFPHAFPKRAYNFVWNTFFRDENLQLEVDIDSDIVLNCAWKKDYFTSALPFQQRGTSPALPISIAGELELPVTGSLEGGSLSGTAGFVHTGPDVLGSSAGTYVQLNNYIGAYGSYHSDGQQSVFDESSVSSAGFSLNPKLTGTTGKYANIGGYGIDGSSFTFVPPVLGSDVVASGDASSLFLTSFNVSDLRVAFQVQKWMERNAIGGVRYNSFLISHFGIAPRDERLQRPQFLGGSKSPVIISEVLQTSASETGEGASYQGNIAGKGISADENFICKYHASEFGYVLGLMVIKPKATYQQGIDKELLYRTRYDWFFPEFAHLSENAVELAEIYAQDSGNIDKNGNPVVFGYQGRYNEMRFAKSMVCGGMRNTFDYWHLGRNFTSEPMLNEDFIKCNPSKRIFVVQDEPGFIVDVGNIVKAFRPLPKYPTPGLIDHN